MRGNTLPIFDELNYSFKMAFTRFQNFRGSCKYLKSDAGSNFMGARNIEESQASHQLLMDVRKDASLNDLVWEVNPPLASHFGGVWERAIRSVRKVIDAVLMDLHEKLLTGEEFRTLLFGISLEMMFDNFRKIIGTCLADVWHNLADCLHMLAVLLQIVAEI